MTPQEAVAELVKRGLSETDISLRMSQIGVSCSQSTVNRIKRGSVRYSWDTGDALIRLAQQVLEGAA